MISALVVQYLPEVPENMCLHPHSPDLVPEL
jgi:hypothetical protein